MAVDNVPRPDHEGGQGPAHDVGEAHDAGDTEPDGAVAVPVETRDRSLDAILHQYPEAMLFALDDLGYRKPVPESFASSGPSVIPMPRLRETTAELVSPSDWMTVVATWEQAKAHGVAVAVVHLVDDPGTPRRLSMIDARHRCGLWMCAFTDLGPDAAVAVPDLPSGTPAARFRPRTATMHKSFLAVITAVDERTTQMMGWTADEMVGVRALDFIHPDDEERAIASYMEMLSKQGTHRVRLRHRCADGTWLWLEVENTYVPADDPEDVIVVAHVTDISDEMAAQSALEARERLLRRVAESVPTGLLQIDSDRAVVFANRRFGQILGITGADTLDGYLSPVAAGDRLALDEALAAVLGRGVEDQLEVDVVDQAAAKSRRCTVALVAISDGEGSTGALVCVNDVTESVRLRQELEVRATFDALTGCYNRASVVAALDRALLDGGDRSTAVIFVDLDGFKSTNDELGHAAGDAVLVAAAKLLGNLFRGDDIVGRIGGDEFLVVCRGIDGPEEALAIGERVATALNRPLDLAAATVRLQASIGIALSGRASTSDSLIAHADSAMYRSKREGTGRPVLYGDDLAEVAVRATCGRRADRRAPRAPVSPGGRP